MMMFCCLASLAVLACRLFKPSGLLAVLAVSAILVTGPPLRLEKVALQ